MGVPPGFRTGDLPRHNALFTHGTPLGWCCPGSDFVPIWDPLLWRNRTYHIFFTSPCWILLDCGRLGLGNKKCYALLTLTPSPPFSFLDYLLGKGGVKKWVPNRGSPAPQCTVHPRHATRVSLPGQRFRSHMRPASMT